ncbi:MAG: hypothetical protein IKV69_01925 [Clostridia bacterium]|nr:hypothetical protein [Clostridia bacterium]
MTIWGKVVLFLKEKKHIALQIACGDVTNIKMLDGKLIITTDEKYIKKILDNPENQNILKDALAWQGINADVEVKRVLKLAELQEMDLNKLKGFGLDVKIEKGD